jgi:8-oxo-dGTP pyrophosphatase MutT (NUDIX family)
MAAEAAPSLCPTFDFTIEPSTTTYSVPCKTYLDNQPPDSPEYGFAGTGAIVITTRGTTSTSTSTANSRKPFTDTEARILLVQRAMHDTMPGQWEVPGGACDEEDESILHSVARELWEEAGLTATSIGPAIGHPHTFLSRSGKLICKLHFLVEVQCPSDEAEAIIVKLDRNEHQHYVWATKAEVKAKKVGDLELTFTSTQLEDIMLEAFRAER